MFPGCAAPAIFAGADKLPTHINAETTRIFRVAHPPQAVEDDELLKWEANPAFGGGNTRDTQLNARHVGSS